MDQKLSRVRLENYRLRYPRAVLGAHLDIQGRLIITGPGKVVVGQHCSFDDATERPNKIQTFDPAATVTIGKEYYLNGIEIAAQTSVVIGTRCIVADCLMMDTDCLMMDTDCLMMDTDCLMMDTDFHSIEVNRSEHRFLSANLCIPPMHIGHRDSNDASAVYTLSRPSAMLKLPGRH